MEILLVEDDAVFARVLSRALERRGHAVRWADTHASALAAADAQRPKAAVVDLKLAESSGLDLIEPLLAAVPGLRILILTGYASIATAVAAVKRGAFDYLPKPANASEILAALAGDGSAGAGETLLSPRRLEWEQIQRVLGDHGGNISATARALGIHRRTLQRKLAKRPVRK